MKIPRINLRLDRRGFITASAAICGVSTTDLLSRSSIAANSNTNSKSAISIFLTGGQSHLDTLDPKPDNPDVRGEFSAIETNVPGVQVSECLPYLAKQADKFLILRSLAHTAGVHEPGQRYLRSGNRAIPSLVYPEIGSVIAKEHASPKGIPCYVRLPQDRSGVVESAGYLGVAYKSFAVHGDANADDFEVRALTRSKDLSTARIENRIKFMKKMDRQFRSAPLQSQDLAGMDVFYTQAFDVLRSQSLKNAFDLSKVDEKTRDSYGRTSLGQAMLVARRLVEVGVRFVGIDVGGWDTHDQNFPKLKDRLLPPWDQGLAALINDLHQRGRLDTTLVWSSGEFGRTPKINENAGRDHWPRAMSMLIAGGGVRGGQVVGKTDKDAAEPVTGSYKPDDVAASFLHLLGIDHHKEYHTPDGRPIMIVQHGVPINDLWS